MVLESLSGECRTEMGRTRALVPDFKTTLEEVRRGAFEQHMLPLMFGSAGGRGAKILTALCERANRSPRDSRVSRKLCPVKENQVQNTYELTHTPKGACRACSVKAFKAIHIYEVFILTHVQGLPCLPS